MSSQVPAPCAPKCTICGASPTRTEPFYGEAEHWLRCASGNECPISLLGRIAPQIWDRLQSAISAHTEEALKGRPSFPPDEQRPTIHGIRYVSEAEMDSATASAVSEAQREAWDRGVQDERLAFIYGEENGVRVKRVNPYLEDGGSSDAGSGEGEKGEKVECQSCGGDFLGNLVDSTCRGCGKAICQSCCDVFDHWKGGLHGSGDPQAEVDRLRAAPTEEPEPQGEPTITRPNTSPKLMETNLVDKPKAPEPAHTVERIKEMRRANGFRESADPHQIHWHYRYCDKCGDGQQGEDLCPCGGTFKAPEPSPGQENEL